MLAFSDGCCPRIDWYGNGRKQQGTYIIQTEKVNENCHYVLEEGEYQDGIWMCGDSWWGGKLSDKGKCKGQFRATTNSTGHVYVQDDLLKWQGSRDGGVSWEDIPLRLNCVDLCL